jgi:two-component system, cell cycle sensor histidine kinase and response regulator CckA
VSAREAEDLVVARILVIEDNEPLRDSAVRILSSAGYDVIAASSGAEGIQVWRELGADLVLTDARMADIDGLRIILELRAAAPHLPVILMSGDPGASSGLPRNLPGSGSVSFLAKPFRKAQLLAAAASALDSPGSDPGEPRLVS